MVEILTPLRALLSSCLPRDSGFRKCSGLSLIWLCASLAILFSVVACTSATGRCPRVVARCNFGFELCAGSPITFIAQDGGTPKVTGSGLSVAQNGIMASFKIDAHGLWGNPDVRIDGPDSEPELSMEEEEEGVYTVSYLPLEIGVFDVHVRWNGKDVPGM